MATFRRIDDDNLDDELMADLGNAKSSKSEDKIADDFVDLDLKFDPPKPDSLASQRFSSHPDAKTKFRRIEDSDLGNELKIGGEKSVESSASDMHNPETGTVRPLVVDDLNTSPISLENNIPPTSINPSASIDPTTSVNTPKKASKSHVGLIVAFLVLVILGAGAFFFLKGQKKEIPVFTISYTSKEPSIKVLLNGLEAPVEKEEGIYKIKVDKGVNSSLTFKMAGYKDKKVDIDTSVDMSKDLGEIVLEKQIPEKTIFFTCKEPDVEILLDNEKQKLENKDGLYTISDIPEGKHSIVIKKSGFKTVNKDFDLKENEGIELGTIELQITDFKKVKIEVSPIDVEVFVDGELVKTERKNNYLMTDYLEPKVVKVEIRAKGFKPHIDEHFEIYSDISSSIGPITLEKIDEKKSDKNSKKEEKKK